MKKTILILLVVLLALIVVNGLIINSISEGIRSILSYLAFLI
jgi:hypothetical protein